MNKFKFLIKSSFLRKLKSKPFIISQFIVSALIILIFLVGSIILSTTKTTETSDLRIVLVHELEDYQTEILGKLSSSFAVNVVFSEKRDFSIEEFWETDEFDVIIVFDDKISFLDTSKIDYATKSTDSLINKSLDQAITTLKSVLPNGEQYQMDVSKLENLLAGMNPDAAIAMSIGSGLFSFSMIFILIAVQVLGSEIIEEKSTKAIEIIIASVPTRSHFFSRIFSNFLFVLFQAILLLLYIIIGALIAFAVIKLTGTSLDFLNQIAAPVTSVISISAVVVIISLVVTILGIFLYLVIGAFFASFSGNNEEFGKAITPITMLLLGSFLVGMLLLATENHAVLMWLSFIPFFAPMLLPIGMMVSAITIWQALISLIIMVFSIIGLSYLLLPAYQVSILNYSNEGLFRRIKNSFLVGRTVKKKGSSYF